jgi:hypothetical protein
LLIGDGEFEQKYLNKKEQERLKNRTQSLRHSHVAHYRPRGFSENSKEEEVNEEEEEEEEGEEEKYFEDHENPFGSHRPEYESIDEEDDETLDEIQQLNSQVKKLETVTLLVIEETLLEDFIIKNKQDQARELSNIGKVSGKHYDSKEEDKNYQPNNEQTEQMEESKVEEDCKEDEKELQEDQSIQGGPEARAAKNSLKTVKFDLLLKQILLPFFQIQTRILKKGNIFEIGSMKFLVAATAPYKQGKVGTQTKIR